MIVTMMTIGICCCLSLTKVCCVSCCSQGKQLIAKCVWTMEIHRLQIETVEHTHMVHKSFTNMTRYEYMQSLRKSTCVRGAPADICV